MERRGPTPSTFRCACRPGGGGTGGEPTAAEDHHCCWTNAITYVRVCVCLCICGLRMCANSTTPSYLAWEREISAAVSIIPLGSRSGGGSAGRTAAAAGPGRSCWLSQERSAPPPSRVLCCRLCLTSQEKEKKQAWKEVALHPPLPAGPAGGRPYGSCTGGAPAATPLPTNALYASRRQLRAWLGVCADGGGALSWTGSLLFNTLPAANFGPGPAWRRQRRWGVQLVRESLCTPLAADFGPGGG